MVCGKESPLISAPICHLETKENLLATYSLAFNNKLDWRLAATIPHERSIFTQNVANIFIIIKLYIKILKIFDSIVRSLHVRVVTEYGDSESSTLDYLLFACAKTLVFYSDYPF